MGFDLKHNLTGLTRTETRTPFQFPNDAPNLHEMSDQTGLVWLLRGRRVVKLTKDIALIETANGTLRYPRCNKPALGPGDGSEERPRPSLHSTQDPI